MDKSITTLNAKFHTGASDERYCDCVGLALLHMRKNGLNSINEQDIPRGLTLHTEMQRVLKELNFEQVQGNFYPCEWLISLMYYDNENGHIGIYFPGEDAIYHMAPFGLSAIRPTSNTTFWKYNGY